MLVTSYVLKKKHESLKDSQLWEQCELFIIASNYEEIIAIAVCKSHLVHIIG